jgi:acyl-CoA synthetase (NDP forming)
MKQEHAAQKHVAIERLFHPRNVVLVGASDRPDHWSRRVWDNLKRFRFTGGVFPVNPNRREIWGAACFPSLDALPEAPDHLVVFTPAETSLKVLRDGAKAGARSGTLYAAGFGEGGDAEGLRLATSLRAVLDDTGLTMVGPNCMGVACGKSNFCSIPDETLQELADSPVAVVAQSGAICASINRAINELGLKVSYFASCGGQIGCKISDFIDYFAVQPELKVILCYIEGIPDAAHFLAASRRARHNGKTVIAVKIGASETARTFALAHTGSLAGTAEAFDAYAAAAGIVRLVSIEDAIEAVEFLARSPMPRGPNIAAVTNSGALRNLITEAADRTGATLAPLSDATREALRNALDQDDITNPFDTKRTIPPSQYVACIDAFVNAPEVDIVLAAEELPRDDGAGRRVANLRSLEDISRRAAALGKPVAVFTPFITSATDYGRATRAQIPHVPVMRDIERTLRIMRALAEAGAQRLSAEPLPAPADNDLARVLRTRAAALDGPAALNEVESKRLLQAYGISVPQESMVRTAAEAIAAARRIGFPVVLKAVSAAITHKSDAGLVLLDLRDDTAVQSAFAQLTARCNALKAKLDGVLVAQQVSGGTECVLGISRDPEMGPVVMFGLGGIWVELFKDVSFAPAGLDRDQALAMVKATRAGRLIDGFRGAKPGDREALLDALVNLGRLAHDLGDVIDAVDINPFLVGEHGAFALDGLVVLRPASSATDAQR